MAGKLLQEKKTLGSYLIEPDSVLTVTMSKCAGNLAKKSTSCDNKEGDNPACNCVYLYLFSVAS